MSPVNSLLQMLISVRALRPSLQNNRQFHLNLPVCYVGKIANMFLHYGDHYDDDEMMTTMMMMWRRRRRRMLMIMLIIKTA